jgi:hypothetical protein
LQNFGDILAHPLIPIFSQLLSGYGETPIILDI